MRSAQEGYVEICCLLLSSPAVQVNKKNNEGMNALMLAAQRGHAHVVAVLVKAGASMDEQTAQGSTALMLAAKRAHGEVTYRQTTIALTRNRR
jgi:ankyrin repeat protein